MKIIRLFSFVAFIYLSSCTAMQTTESLDLKLGDIVFQVEESISNLEVMSGSGATVFIGDFETGYMITRDEPSLLLGGVPEVLEITNSVFFERLTDPSFTNDDFNKYREIFEINKDASNVTQQVEDGWLIVLIDAEGDRAQAYISNNSNGQLYLLETESGKAELQKIIDELIIL